ncbi:CHAT domain-containing protein [Ahrensia sp. R2A130]|uniref:CHAT domain-containing protein n=1 Tax=Ahrensia sp. R2A130 TaxID=744979 RepID=UPI0001E0E09B|nr:CHAT domain-containing protein [Ahrensia sp. R2A130]EFL89319.1 tetratricopeptide TPR_4 containing protein [Ahrensia sp. R2A130]
MRFLPHPRENICFALIQLALLICLIAGQVGIAQAAVDDDDLGHARVYYTMLDEVQDAYFRNESDVLIERYQHHQTKVQETPTNDFEIARVLHFYGLSVRFFRLLGDRENAEKSFNNGVAFLSQIKDQALADLLEARLVVERAELDVLYGRPREAIDYLLRISAELRPNWVSILANPIFDWDDLKAADPELAALATSAASAASLLMLEAATALERAEEALELLGETADDPASRPNLLIAHLRRTNAMSLLSDPQTSAAMSTFLNMFIGKNATRPLLTVQSVHEFGPYLMGEQAASHTANMAWRLIQKAELSPQHPVVLNGQMSLAFADDTIGKTKESFNRYLAVMNTMRAGGAAESIMMADVFMELARTLAINGEPDAARELAEASVDMSGRLGSTNTELYSIRQLDLATIYSAIGLNIQAGELLVENEKRVMNSQTTSGVKASKIASLAATAQRIGKGDQALSLYRLAIKEMENAAIRGVADLPIINGYANLLLEQDEREDALTVSRTAIARLQEIVAQEKSILGLQQFDPEANRRMRVFRNGNKPLFSRLMALLVDLPQSLAVADEAFQASQWANGSRVEDVLFRVNQRNGVEDEGLRDLLRKQQDLNTGLMKVAKRIDTMRAQGKMEANPELVALDGQSRNILLKVSQVEAELRKRFPDFQERASIDTVSIKEIQSRLGEENVVLSYFQTESRVFGWAISTNGFAFRKLTPSTVELAASIKTLRASIETSATVRGADSLDEGVSNAAKGYDRALAYALYKQLMEPFSKITKGRGVILHQANGALSSLPLSLLISQPPLGEDTDAEALRSSAWLIRDHAFVTLPSISYIAGPEAQSNGADTTKSDGPQLVAFGAPVLGGIAGATRALGNATALFDGELANVEAVRALAPLPNTKRELESIAKALDAPSSTLKLAEEASETAVKTTAFIGADVVIFATHGLVAGELSGLTEPALVFTPPKKASEEDDGLLTASELALLDLDAEWVIFSACNTAAGDGSNGAEGLSGLASAALYAGARSLLVSHWPVLDDAAADLTINTLQAQRQNNSLSRAKALQKAMLKLMDDKSKPAYAHPAAWAPFVLVGTQ